MKKIILLFSLLSINPINKIGYCDIKGNVNNPGVYEVLENDTIKNIIDKAGGLKKNSYTDNINLSKKVNDEMVIYIHSKNEIEKHKELNNCDCSPIYKYIDCPIKKQLEETTTVIVDKTTNKIEPTTITTTNNTTKLTTTIKNSTTKIESKKININTSTIEDLITIKGLGESKANKIIEYRNTNGLFLTIEDILKVSGIGESTFEKIKEYIEV